MIVLLHGALGSASQLLPIQKQLGDRESCIIEFPGHGQKSMVNGQWSVVSSQWSIDSLALFLEQQLEQLRSTVGGPISIFGYSMGGYVALKLAITRPDLIGSILTLGTKLKWDANEAAKEVKKLDPEVIEAKVPAFAADLKQRHGEDRWKIVLSKTAHLMTNLADSPLTHEHVNRLTSSVRYCVGDRDEMVTLEETHSFFAATPNAQLAVLPGTRHPIEKVNVKLLQQQFADFFAE